MSLCHNLARPDPLSVGANLLLPLEASKFNRLRPCRAREDDAVRSSGKPCCIPNRRQTCCGLEPPPRLHSGEPGYPGRRHRHRPQALGEPRVMDSRDGTVFTHEVSLQISAPLSHLWSTWFDLESIPNWMQWIDKVETLSEHVLAPSPPHSGATSSSPPHAGGSPSSSASQASPAPQDAREASGATPHWSGAAGFPPLPEVTRWVCSSKGFEVAWTARITHVEVEHEGEAQGADASSRHAGAGVNTRGGAASSSPPACPGAPIPPGQVPPTLPAGGGRVRRACVQWVTEEGLSNAGVIVFERLPPQAGRTEAGKGDAIKGGAVGGEERTNVRLSISHLLPRRLASAVGATSLRSLVQATLTSDLKRFEKVSRYRYSEAPQAV
eukprot:jgi/Mesvir1/5394/Mv15468-RA.1